MNKFFADIGNGLNAYSKRRSRVDQIERLEARFPGYHLHLTISPTGAV